MNLKKKNKDISSNSSPSQVSIQKTSYYSGVLPPPEALQKYEQLLKGTAERLLTLAEKEADHRRDVTTQAMKKYYLSYNLGQSYDQKLCMS